MIDIEKYISELIECLKNHFQNNLLYVGLQGSYLRGEANDDSDIDIMVVLNKLDVSDLDEYRLVIRSLDHADLSCGFICCKNDLFNWNPLEICHLLHSTKDYYGKLIELTPLYNNDDIKNFIKISINNLYHEICHRYIHSNIEKNIFALPQSYKSVFFILQNIHYLKSGNFVCTKKELLSRLNGSDHKVLKTSLEINNTPNYNFNDAFTELLYWCQNTLIDI